MARLGRLPRTNDRVSHDGWLVQVVDVEGRRAARVRLSPPRESTQEQDEAVPAVR
jgi:CBS domain containing-hemolysin-like protein